MMFQKTALDLWHEECGQRPIITGSRRLDQAIGNGIPVHVITEFCGPPGSGKTQLCLQLCVNVQIPTGLGGLDGSAVYIDTSHGFTPRRLREIAVACVDHLKRVQSRHSATSNSDAAAADLFTADRILDRVLYTYASTATELLAAVYHLRQLLASSSNNHAPVRLIVIDSLAAVFRDNCGNSRTSSSNGGLTSLDRVRVLYDLMSDLEALARRHGCAVVLTNEITTRVSGKEIGQTSRLVPALGDTHCHRIGQQVALGRDVSDGASSEQFVACVTKSLSRAESTVPFKITGDGIRDV